MFSLIMAYLAVVSTVFAQTSDEPVLVEKALVMRIPRGSLGSPIRKEPIEAQIVRGEWEPPQEGEVMELGDDNTGVWESVVADEEGWFTHRSLRGGYAYISVEAAQQDIQLLQGMAHEVVYVNGEPRGGNRYQSKDKWASWEPRFDYYLVPILLKEGRNDLLFHCYRGRLKVRLQRPKSEVFFNTKDVTVPSLIVGQETDAWGSVVIINASTSVLDELHISCSWEGNVAVLTQVPIIQPLSIRKVGFRLKGPAPTEEGALEAELKLLRNSDEQTSVLDTAPLTLRGANPHKVHNRTFISDIDGSVQYYALNPARDDEGNEPLALFLSVHGAGVIATNQARSYAPKTWGHLVAPTNRRPYGFDWEDWGRLDALEVLNIVQEELNIAPNRVYLTGHSMGGHGTWHLGVIFPDRFAAIGPSAAWISFGSYRRRETSEELPPIVQIIRRASLPSDTLALSSNYKHHGVYILHGADDDNVPAEQSRRMNQHLSEFHRDFIYHEQPGVGHWWNVFDDQGTDCVDWQPMFDFFARHARPGKQRLRRVEFTTANPGISSSCYWLSIEAQIEQLKLSHADVRFDPGRKRFVGTTKNVARLAFELIDVKPDDKISLELDGQKLEDISWDTAESRLWLQRHDEQWTVIERPSLQLKGPHRYGTFKDAFRHRVMFVYGTKGTDEENKWAFAKARYDAETFWYRGNASVDIIADVDFEPESEPNRNVILYGNSDTNAAWAALLVESPVQVSQGVIRVGERTISRDDLGCLFIRPRPDSETASVGVVSGSGIIGMRLTDRRRYLSPGYALPDCVVLGPEVLTQGSAGIRVAGFFGNDWSIVSGEFVWAD